MGSKNTTTQSRGVTLLPHPGRRIPRCNNSTGEGGAGRQRAGRRRRREEPGRRQEGPGAGGAKLDPGHSHNVDPRQSRRKEEPWRRNGPRLQGADHRWRSRWWRSPRWRQRANELGDAEDPGGPGWSLGLWRPRWRRRSVAEPDRLRTKF